MVKMLTPRRLVLAYPIKESVMRLHRSLLVAWVILFVATLLVAAAPAAAHDLHGDRLTAISPNRAQVSVQPGELPPSPLGLVLVGVIVLLALAIRLAPVLGRNRSHAAGAAPASYGPAGGAICPRCGRTFARSLLSPNMLVGKLSRCPHCGKWSVVAAAAPSALAAAEAARRGPAEGLESTLSPEEKLRRQIEDSKYER
jgi:hypothetical protein